MGRSVRGEKDYSVVVAIGADLVRTLRDVSSRRYLSSQMATQIEIGLEIAEMAREEIAAGKEPLAALVGLINQCLKRDDGWKDFYADQMKKVAPKGANKEILSCTPESSPPSRPTRQATTIEPSKQSRNFWMTV